MKGFFQRAFVQWFFRPWRKPLANSSSRFVEPPQSDTQMPERVDERRSRSSHFEREHQQRSMRKVAVSKCLLKSFPPVGHLSFDRRQTNTTPECERSKVVCTRPTRPGDPHDIRSSESFDSELTTRNSRAALADKIRLFKLLKKVRFGALLRRPRRQVLPRVMAAGRQQDRSRSFQIFVHWNCHSSITAFDPQRKPAIA